MKWLRLIGNVILIVFYKKNFRLKSIQNLNSTVYCELCKCEVDNMSNSGRNINTHLTKKKKHQLAQKAASSSGKVINYFKDNTYSSDNLLNAAKE